MSLELIKKAFEQLSNIQDMSIQLLNIRTSKRTGTGYSSRQITLDSNNSTRTFINDVVNVYLGTGKKRISQYREIREYDGTADAMVIYKLSINNALINSEYSTFITAIASPDCENDPFEYTSAYLVKGLIQIDGEDVNIKLISMQSAITTLKHKFLHNNGTFKPITDKILSLRPTMDVLIINDTVYFLTLAGENLFNMARSYRAVCQDRISVIEECDILSDISTFKNVASSGHNPRRFVSFSDDRLKALKRKSTRISMARQFSIPLDSNDKFDTSVDGASEKIVKLLCNKGMIDPFAKAAVEVDGAKKWQ